MITFISLEPKSFVPPYCPIQPGLFKGTYSGHGIEIVNIFYEQDERTLIGKKVTGDENVPCNQESFKAFLNKQLFLQNREDRESFDLILSHHTETEILGNGHRVLYPPTFKEYEVDVA